MKKYKDLSDNEKSVIDGLTKTIDKLREQVKEFYPFKERFMNTILEIKSLEERLRQKHNTVRILKREKEGMFVQKIVKIDDTLEGLFIEIN